MTTIPVRKHFDLDVCKAVGFFKKSFMHMLERIQHRHKNSTRSGALMSEVYLHASRVRISYIKWIGDRELQYIAYIDDYGDR